MMISVVVPVYNNPKASLQCVRAIATSHAASQGSGLEVLVVDDGSETDMREVVDGFPQARLVRVPHRGPVRARNIGWRLAKGEIVAFVDSDVVVCRDWVRELSAPFSDPTITCVEGPLIELTSHGYFRHRAENAGGSYLTANVAYRRTVLASIDGLDERVSVLGVFFREDTDLALRARRIGGTVLAPDAVAYHRGRPISFFAKVRESRRYLLDPLLFVKHGFKAFRADSMRVARVTIPLPRQVSAWLIFLLAYWSVGGRTEWPGLVALAIFSLRTVFSIGREGERTASLRTLRAAGADTLSMLVMMAAHVVGTGYILCLSFRRNAEHHGGSAHLAPEGDESSV